MDEHPGESTSKPKRKATPFEKAMLSWLHTNQAVQERITQSERFSLAVYDATAEVLGTKFTDAFKRHREAIDASETARAVDQQRDEMRALLERAEVDLDLGEEESLQGS